MIEIDRYDAVIENGVIRYYALKGKKRYPMPDCYKEMYTEDYLAIEEKDMEMPELYATTSKHYIPMRHKK